MRWRATTNDPDLMGATLLLDGVEVRAVTAFDDVDGWVETLCPGGRDGHPYRFHADPADESEVCLVLRTGKIELVLP